MSHGEEEYVAIEVIVRRVTDKAVMIECEDAGVDEQWIPQSLINWTDSEAAPTAGSVGELYVAKWFVDREGLA